MDGQINKALRDETGKLERLPLQLCGIEDANLPDAQQGLPDDYFHAFDEGIQVSERVYGRKGFIASLARSAMEPLPQKVGHRNHIPTDKG